MRIRVLGCSGGIGAGLRTTCLLVDDDILIDTGTGLGDLDLAALKRIRRVLMTHSHLDHSSGLPLLVDTVFDSIEQPLLVHGRKETLEALKTHIFNWTLWPDFSVLPNLDKPVLAYQPLDLGAWCEFEGRRFRMIEVSHTVPGVGYCLQGENKTFAFSGDTATNDTFWAALNECPRLDILVVETAFANKNEELAGLARHYCPRTLAADIAKLRHDPEIYITHLKPGAEDDIFAEILAALPGRRVHRLVGGEVFDI